MVRCLHEYAVTGAIARSIFGGGCSVVKTRTLVAAVSSAGATAVMSVTGTLAAHPGKTPMTSRSTHRSMVAPKMFGSDHRANRRRRQRGLHSVTDRPNGRLMKNLSFPPYALGVWSLELVSWGGAGPAPAYHVCQERVSIARLKYSAKQHLAQWHA